MMRPSLSTFLLIASISAAPAQGGCAAAIRDFQRVIDADVESRNLNKSVHARIGPQLAPVAETCRAGREAEAMRSLARLKDRYGYR